MFERKPWLVAKTKALVIGPSRAFDTTSLQHRELCIERAEIIKYTNRKQITVVVYCPANNCLRNLLHY